MKRKSKKIDISKVLSNNEEITEKDILTLMVLMEQGRIANPKLLKELNLRGADLRAPESAGHYRRKLEKMGVLEGYPAKINWKKVGYPTEFVVIATADKKDMLLEIERGHIAGIKEYKEHTGANILVIPLGEKGEKIILRDVLFGGEKPMAIISGVATDDWAATTYADFYLPKSFPGIKTTLLIIQRSSIRDFEFQDELIESLTTVLFSAGELEKYKKKIRRRFRWDLLKPCK